MCIRDRVWIDLGELGSVEDVAPVGERVERLDAAGAAGADADRPRRGDRRRRRVTQRWPPGALPPRTGPRGEAAAALGEPGRGCQRLAYAERREPVGEGERGLG